MSDHLTDCLSPVLLIGAGKMAVEYARVLTALRHPFVVVGRSADSTQQFTAKTGAAASKGGLKSWLPGRHVIPAYAIAAVDVEQLAGVVELLLRQGVKKILVEKPGGLHAGEICRLSSLAAREEADVFVAYNRRFYASVKRARELIDVDGGVRSFSLEFTELSKQVEALELSSVLKANWLLANSTHVIDLAFHLGGTPTRLSCFSAGSTSWHPAAAIFAGAGTTLEGALFTYRADWGSLGRWSIEILTSKRRLFLCPLEELQEQIKPLGEKRKLNFDDRLDRDFKPGLYRMIRAFLYNKDASSLLTVKNQCRMASGLYRNILYGKVD